MRIKAPPQKRKSVIRVQSAETQDYKTEQQGLERKWCGREMEELSFNPSSKRLKQGERKVTASRRWEMIEPNASRGKLWVLWVDFGMEQVARRMWEHFTIEKAWARSLI